MRWGRLSRWSVGRLLARSAPTGSLWFLFDRDEVQRFLSLECRRMQKQRGSGGLQGQRGVLERDAEGLLFNTAGRVSCLALVDQGPLAVAGWVVRPGQSVQGQGCVSGLAGHGHAESNACFRETRGRRERRIAMILEHGRPRERVVRQLRAVALWLFGSLCCLGDRRERG